MSREAAPLDPVLLRVKSLLSLAKRQDSRSRLAQDRRFSLMNSGVVRHYHICTTLLARGDYMSVPSWCQFVLHVLGVCIGVAILVHRIQFVLLMNNHNGCISVLVDHSLIFLADVF